MISSWYILFSFSCQPGLLLMLGSRGIGKPGMAAEVQDTGRYPAVSCGEMSLYIARLLNRLIEFTALCIVDDVVFS